MSNTLIQALKEDEGFLATPTDIGDGVQTLGHGYNITAADNPTQDLINAGLTSSQASKVLAGEVELTEAQGAKLLNISAKRAQEGARRVVSNYDELPPNVQEVVANVSYQVGTTGLKKFRRMRKALAKEDYEEAAKELIQSDMGKKYKTRVNRHVDKLLATPPKKSVKERLHVSKEHLKSIQRDLMVKRAAKSYNKEFLMKRLAKSLPPLPKKEDENKPTTNKEEEVVTNATP